MPPDATPTSPPTALQTLPNAEHVVLRTIDVPVERHEVVVDGLRLHYLTCGEGEPLVMLHGRGSAGALFAPVFPQLAREHRVYALDLPGWGLSDKPRFVGHSAQEALDLWVGAVRGFMDALGLERADVLGHSMGGFTALGLALASPERVWRLVLVDSGGLGVDIPLDIRLYFWLKPERLNRLFGRRFFDYALSREQPARASGQLPAAPLRDFMYSVMAQEDVIPSGAAAFNAWVNVAGVHLDFRGRLRELAMPVLMLWGDRDRLTPYADALKAARRMPNAKLVAFSHCGHTPFLERSADFARVLAMWLDGAPVSSRV